MTKTNLGEFMSFNKNGKRKTPLFVSEVNGKFIIAAYQGALSQFDILVKYRQKEKGEWSRIRTPKHIHWAVDVLLKMYADKQKTEDFLDFLIEIWNKTQPIKSEQERKKFLSIENLLKANKKDIQKYEELSKKGEYSVKFLILLARLLMTQEKTNLHTAYMFKNLLKALKSGEDIFKIVSIATHTRR